MNKPQKYFISWTISSLYLQSTSTSINLNSIWLWHQSNSILFWLYEWMNSCLYLTHFIFCHFATFVWLFFTKICFDQFIFGFNADFGVSLNSSLLKVRIYKSYKMKIFIEKKMFRPWPALYRYFRRAVFQNLLLWWRSVNNNILLQKREAENEFVTLFRIWSHLSKIRLQHWLYRISCARNVQIIRPQP